MYDNRTLRARVAKLTRIMSGLKSDLAAARQALSEEIAAARGENAKPMRSAREI